jgi:hyperosmotically inducible periplasmic protein
MKRTLVAATVVTLVLVGVAGTNLAMAGSETAQKFDDIALLTRIKADLLQSGSVDGLDVNVDVKDGNVTLSGWANNDAERASAAQLAGKVDGVKQVDNRIQIKK